MAEAGIARGITEFKVADIPVGGVAVGLFASGFVDGIMGLLEGLAKRKLPVFLVKGIGAYAANRYLPRYIGSDGARFATAILAVDAVQSLYDVRGLTSGLFAKVSVGGLTGIGQRREELPEVIIPPELRGGSRVGGEEITIPKPEEEIVVSVT